MNNSDTMILWPSIGCPHRLDKDQRLAVIVAGCTINENQTISGVLLTAVGTRIKMNLVNQCKQQLKNTIGPGIWPDWLKSNFPNVLVLSFKINNPPVLKIYRTLLCDIELKIGSQSFKKPNSAYFSNDSTDGIKTLTANDIHAARRWQTLRNSVNDLFPKRQKRIVGSKKEMATFVTNDAWTQDCFMDSFIDANYNLGRFISIANTLWKQGQLDLVILSGDLVDYKFSKVRNKSNLSFKESEWSFFEDLLLGQTDMAPRLLVPLYTAVGNHDYRLHPYKLQIYGIRHSGIADEFTTEYLKRKGQYQKFKFSLSDLNAIRINRSQHHSLNFYYQRINPFSTYSADLKHGQIVVLDTGPDFFCEKTNFFSKRWNKFISSVIESCTGPRSSGYDTKQLDFLQRKLKGIKTKNPTIIVSHAPILNPTIMPSLDKGEKLLAIHVDDHMSRNSKNVVQNIEFERQIRKNELDASTVFKNQLSFLKTIQESKNQIIVLSGHTHNQIELSLDKAKGNLCIGDYHQRQDLQSLLNQRVLLLQTASLGHVKRGSMIQGHPSYRSVTFSNGNFNEINPSPLEAPPFEYGFDDWTMIRKGNMERIKFSFNRNGKFKEVWINLVCWFRGSLDDYASQHSKMKIKIEPHNVIETYNNSSHEFEGGYISFVVPNIDSVTMIIYNRPKNFPIAFLFETFVKKENQYKSVALRWHHRILKR